MNTEKQKELFNLTGLLDELNKVHQKANEKPFTMGDVQGYVRRLKLPKYLGGNPIHCKVISGVKFYQIIETE